MQNRIQSRTLVLPPSALWVRWCTSHADAGWSQPPRILQAEVAAYIDQFAGLRDENGRRMVVRNGTAEPRTVMTSAGAVEVTAPRVNDKRADPATGERKRFNPAKARELLDGVPGVKAVTLGSAAAGPGGRRIVTDPDEVLTTPRNACKVRKSSHGDVMLPVGVHLPTVKVGCQKLRGQDKIEMKYWIQL